MAQVVWETVLSVAVGEEIYNGKDLGGNSESKGGTQNRKERLTRRASNTLREAIDIDYVV